MLAAQLQLKYAWAYFKEQYNNITETYGMQQAKCMFTQKYIPCKIWLPYLEWGDLGRWGDKGA